MNKEEIKSKEANIIYKNNKIKANKKEESIKEKEQRIKSINFNSNENNSTYNNIINNNTKMLSLNNISSDRKLCSDSTNTDANKNIHIEFGSDIFHKLFKKIPEEKRLEFIPNSEMNYLEYKYSCDCDRRSFMKIFSSLLKEENNIIYSLSFCSDDYNLSIVKFSFLIIQLILYISFTCFFFTDDIINSIFDKKYKFDLIYIRPILFTFLICFVINILLKALSKINNNAIDIKYEKSNYKKGLKDIRLKIIFYFIIGFIFMICGTYLVCIFGAVFINSQIKLIICAGSTLIINFILQIIFCFIISSFRICSLNSEKKNMKCLYNFSKFLTYL